MTAAITQGNDVANREIAMTRVYDAPRERVFAAWTDPAHVSNWWGPRGFTTTTSKMDLRAGGEWLFVMHGPDGTDYPNKVVYQQVERPALLVYRHAGTRDDDPVRFNVTVRFIPHRTENGERTEVNFRMVMDTAEMRAWAASFGAIEGLWDTLTRFDEHLASRED